MFKYVNIIFKTCKHLKSKLKVVSLCHCQWVSVSVGQNTLDFFTRVSDDDDEIPGWEENELTIDNQVPTSRYDNSPSCPLPTTTLTHKKSHASILYHINMYYKNLFNSMT